MPCALSWPWVAAFLFDLGVTFEGAEVQLLAQLRGWEPPTGRTPGKSTLLWGLSRLLSMLTTQAYSPSTQLNTRVFHPRLLPCCMVSNLLAIYEGDARRNALQL